MQVLLQLNAWVQAVGKYRACLVGMSILQLPTNLRHTTAEFHRHWFKRNEASEAG
jgi:hypothetical protein